MAASNGPFPAEIEREDGSIDRNGFILFTDDNSSPTTSQVVLGGFAFTHSTAGLNTGVAIYTPDVGDVILDVWIQVTTDFNGTTPLADVGTFSGGNVGLFGEAATAVDLSTAQAAVTDNAGIIGGGATGASLSSAIISVGILASTGAGAAITPWYYQFTSAANPLLLVVSQNGQKGGTATGATAGAGMVYVAYVSDPFVMKR